MYGESELSSPVQKEYLTKYRHIYYSDQSEQNNLVFFNCRLDYWSGHANRTVCYGHVHFTVANVSRFAEGIMIPVFQAAEPHENKTTLIIPDLTEHS